VAIRSYRRIFRDVLVTVVGGLLVLWIWADWHSKEPPPLHRVSALHAAKVPAVAPSSSLPAFVEPPASLRHNADGTARDFVQLTPEALSHLFRNKTQNELQADIKPYFTKWVAISGVVQDVDTFRSETTVSLRAWNPDAEFPVGAFLTFGKKWTNRVAFLRRGDIIDAVCRVQHLQFDELGVVDCEPFVR
jgi:hypothetical protein